MSMVIYLLMLVIVGAYAQSFGPGIRGEKQHRVQNRNRYRELVLYPRVGKRGPNDQIRMHNMNRRRQFLNLLATNLQRTGGLRGVLQDIQDMSESKRKRSPTSSRDQLNNFLNSLVINRYDQMELDRSARMMQKWSKARIGKRSSATRRAFEAIPVIGFIDESNEEHQQPGLSKFYIDSKKVPMRWNRVNIMN